MRARGGHESGTESVWEAGDDEYDYIMDIDIRGLFNTLSVALSSRFLEPGASVVHIASMFSLKSFKNGAAFTASKHAALGMMRSAAKVTEGLSGSTVSSHMSQAVRSLEHVLISWQWRYRHSNAWRKSSSRELCPRTNNAYFPRRSHSGSRKCRCLLSWERK